MSLHFPLTLRWMGKPLRPAAAWLIAGGDAALWLEEIARWRISMPAIKLLPLPSSLHDPNPCAVLVVPGPEDFHPVQMCAAPYGMIGNRFFLPIDAALDPHVSDAELSARLVYPFQLLHPTIGLIGFSASDVLRVADLIAPPIVETIKWDRARSGPGVAPRLLAVDADAPPTLQTILQGSRDDIGSLAPPEPPAPTPPSKPGPMSRPVLRAMDWIARHSPKFTAKPNWIDALGHWASAALHGVDDKTNSARSAELQRLLEMMQSNPDQGLQYAIPLSPAATRGIAPPGSRLTQRSADFNLSRLGSAGPADPWEIPWQVHQRLLQQYRAAANRELALRRHRRAAYIFAELLGDHGSAANALRQGKHFREAAALYRDHLHDLRAAAECMEEDGQLGPAAGMFESLKMWVRAGDLYARIERPTDAARCWRQAVREDIERRDYLPAARLLEDKLGQPDEALTLLAQAWPASDRAALCLNESFKLLGKLSRHDEAKRRIARLLADGAPPDRIVAMAQTLSATARLYPSTAVRAAAADAVLVVAGKRLPLADKAETTALVQAVTRLAADDHLLSRDGTRFIARQSERPRIYPLARPASNDLKLVSMQTLAGMAEFSVVRAHRDGFYVLGSKDGRRRLGRGNWTGQFQWIDVDPFNIVDFFLTPQRMIPQVIALSENHRFVDENLVLPINETFASLAVVGKPAWISSDHALGMCFDQEGIAWVLDRRDDLGISGYVFHTGNMLARFSVELAQANHLSIAAQKGTVFVAADMKLVQFTQGRAAAMELPSPARDVIVSPIFTRTRAVVTMQEGAMVIWPEAGQQLVAQGLVNPVAGFLSDGKMMIVAGDGGRAFRARDGRVECIANFAGIAMDPLAVASTSQRGEFAVFTRNGQIRTYRADFLDG